MTTKIANKMVDAIYLLNVLQYVGKTYKHRNCDASSVNQVLIK